MHAGSVVAMRTTEIHAEPLRAGDFFEHGDRLRVEDPSIGGVREGYVTYGPHAIVSRLREM